MDTQTESIQEKLDATLERIVRTAQSAGRNPALVRLLVVTKTHPVETVRAAIEAGARLLGENYAEEAVEKIRAIAAPEVEWHMIGHVQSRKADLVAGHFNLMHSLDSLKLANRLDRFAGAAGRMLPVLLEVNVSGEQSKFGYPAWDEAQWPSLAEESRQLCQFPNLELRGLMTMPPFFDEAELSRPYFVRVRRLQEFLSKQVSEAAWGELSMGTSLDFPVAVQEGATIVRVGTAILGARQAHG
jgi:hypothetical protein